MKSFCKVMLCVIVSCVVITGCHKEDNYKCKFCQDEELEQRFYYEIVGRHHRRGIEDAYMAAERVIDVDKWDTDYLRPWEAQIVNYLVPHMEEAGLEIKEKERVVVDEYSYSKRDGYTHVTGTVTNVSEDVVTDYSVRVQVFGENDKEIKRNAQSNTRILQPNESDTFAVEIEGEDFGRDAVYKVQAINIKVEW